MQDTLGLASRKAPPTWQTTLQASWILIGWKPLGSAHHATQEGYIKAANRSLYRRLVPCTSCGTETVWFESPTPLHTKNEPNTIPSLGIYPFTVTTVIEGHGLCTNGHGYLATLARSNRIDRPIIIHHAIVTTVSEGQGQCTRGQDHRIER